MKILIGNKQYEVKEASTPEEKSIGLQNIDSLPENEGMLFYFDPHEEASMTMKSVKFPIDIIFIDEDEEVSYVYKGIPGSDEVVTVPNTMYVLEVNSDSGIKIGDELEFEETEGPVMKVLYQDGTPQYELWGGERIFSRSHTKTLVKKAKKASETQDDKDFKALGKYMFKCIKKQDTQTPEYVEKPQSKE